MAGKSSWLEYVWEVEGGEALFGVELSLYRTAPDPGAPILAYLCCETIGGEDISQRDLKRIEDIAARVAKRIGRRPAGFVQADNVRQYYFYIPDKASYDMMKELASKEKKLVCRVGGKREDNWATYFKFLYPDEFRYQTVRNREQVEKMRNIGDNLDAARRINLHMGFTNEQDRLMFEETARRAGFAIGDPGFEPESEHPNSVVIYRISTLKRREINSVTLRSMELARKFRGVLLYWDCNIVPKSVK